MVRSFAILTPIVVMMLARVACRYGAGVGAKALGRARTRLLLLVAAAFAWLVSALVLLQAARAVRPSGVVALAGEIIHLGALGPAVADLQWSADAVSLAAAGVLYVYTLARAAPQLAQEARAARHNDLALPAFEEVGRLLLLAAGGWTLVFAHSLPAMVLGAGLLIFAEANAEPTSRRIAGGWSLVGWLALAVVTYSPGRPPTTTTLALLGAAGERSIMVRTQLLPGLSYADVAVACVLVALGGLILGRRTRVIAALVAAVVAVHLNAIVALSVWGMACLALAGGILALAPWLRGVAREDAVAFVGAGLVLVCVGMGQFIDGFWVGLTVPLVSLGASSSRRGWRLAALVVAAGVWGPAWLMGSVGASVGSAGLNVLLAALGLMSTVGMAARIAGPTDASGASAASGARGSRGSGPTLGMALALVVLVGCVAARWLGPLTEPLRRLLAVSAQFEGALALGVLPLAQPWSAATRVGLGAGLMAGAIALGAWLRPAVRVGVRAASPVEAFATIADAALSLVHALGVELRNRWWGWRWGGRHDTPRGRARRQLGWAVLAVLAAALSLHRCPSGTVRSPVYDAPGISPRLVSPERARPIHRETPRAEEDSP